MSASISSGRRSCSCRCSSIGSKASASGSAAVCGSTLGDQLHVVVHAARLADLQLVALTLEAVIGRLGIRWILQAIAPGLGTNLDLVAHDLALFVEHLDQGLVAGPVAQAGMVGETVDQRAQILGHLLPALGPLGSVLALLGQQLRLGHAHNAAAIPPARRRSRPGDGV